MEENQPKSNPRIRAWKEFRRDQDRLARQWRKQNNLCIMFGCDQPPADGKTRCKRHTELQRAAHAAWMNRPFKEEDE